MPDSKFLETYPLYRQLEFSTTYKTLDNLPKVPVHMDCERCGTSRTFVLVNEYHEVSNVPTNTPAKGFVCRLVYICTFCEKSWRYFVVRFAPDGDTVFKIGQYPPWSIELDKDLKEMLGEHSELYRKGLVSESQSYGVGAFAYYRQIVETVIDDLLDQIGGLIPDADRAEYAKALAATKKTKVAQEKIELVKDLLPDILRPDALNPLTVLHDALSEGLHAGTDEECLGLAAQVREVLVFLVHQVSVTKSRSKSFTDGIRKLLDRKREKAT